VSGAVAQRPDERIADDARLARVVDLRRDGWSFRRIAAEVGYDAGSSAMRAYERACQRHLPPSTIMAERARMLDGLDEDEAKCWAIFGRFHPVVSGGDLVRDQNGELLEDVGPKLAALDRVLRIRERRARLLGLDAPARARVEVVGEDALDALIASYTEQLSTIDAQSSVTELAP
jgi:hypothetical protein